MIHFFSDFFSTTYGFGPGIGGLCYLGLGIGFFLATLFGAKFADEVYLRVRYDYLLVRVPFIEMPIACS